MHYMALPLVLMGAHAPQIASGPPMRMTMAEAISQALGASPSIAIARHRLAAARAEVGMARGMLGIHITGGVLAGAARSETIFESPGAGPAPSAMLGTRTSANLAAAAMAPIDTGGALEAGLHRAEAMLAMAGAELSSARSQVVAEVKEAYLEGRFAAAMLAVAEADRQAARAMADNAKADWEAGRGIEATYLRAIARLRAAEREVAGAEAERAKSATMLARAMGLEPGMRVEAGEDPKMERPFVSLDEAIGTALSESPMIHAVRKRLDAAREDQRVAEANRRPQVYVSLMGAVSTHRTMGGSSMATLGLTATMPIADGGVRKHARAKADADANAAAEQVRAATIEVEADVRTAWSDLLAAEASLVAAQAASVAARAAYEVVELRVRNQKSILVEQLDALTAVREADEAAAQARRDFGLAVTRLERLVGKG